MSGNADPDWFQIQRISGVQRALQYGDGERALRDEDLSFVRWMKDLHGLLEVSKVVQVGSKIKVVSGPLKEYEGKIVEVKKHRKMVAIELSAKGHFGRIWCPVEYIEVI